MFQYSAGESQWFVRVAHRLEFLGSTLRLPEGGKAPVPGKASGGSEVQSPRGDGSTSRGRASGCAPPLWLPRASACTKLGHLA
eukprot:CAMPEP_0171225808 /NCGR_PEP_ID=MMETSP0790-20130122/36997_1 /TAXON_ID=2925 /ORGANISM="Alexandrium catenella, Strain OF101" /LENGTH=82 /DNA_ID=CAMNT_0011691851 /DNA_START=227 /DNA_END=471 /DNA_ORIENTATION=-